MYKKRGNTTFLNYFFNLQNVSPSESGQYVCLSKHLDGSKISAGEVEMIVKGSTFSAIDAVKLVAIVVSIIVIIGCAVIYWRLRKQWRKYDGRTVVPGLFRLKHLFTSFCPQLHLHSIKKKQK